MITCDSLVYQPFRPAGGALACDGVSIQSIVERAGTPTYIYSARAIRESYRDIDEARPKMGSFIETVYNRQRLHSALDCLTSEKYEGKLTGSGQGCTPARNAENQNCHLLPCLT